MEVRITDFARERGVKTSAVAQWLRQHKTCNFGVTRKGKYVLVNTDSPDYPMLDRQYQVNVESAILDSMYLRKIVDLQDQLRLRDARLQILENEHFLLEEKTSECEDALAELALAKDEISRLVESEAAVTYERDELRTELERLKNRTFWQRLFNR